MNEINEYLADAILGDDPEDFRADLFARLSRREQLELWHTLKRENSAETDYVCYYMESVMVRQDGRLN